MMDDLDEDDDHRWSHGVTRETNRKGCRTEFWVNGWMDGWTHGYLFTPPTGRVGVKGVFCICFRIELITGTYGTSHRNCVGVQIETIDPAALA